MNKSCAKCQKTVYPLEELKCLDKIWHKGCFKCNECGMTLNMKTYKGFDKMPYCEAHVPKAKATTVADTPEFKRISENTKIQSNAVYHAEFEKAKGKFTQVADDPELMRIKQNTKIISNVAYHGDLEKKAQMEKNRALTGEDGDVKNKNGVTSPRSPPSYMDEISSVPTSSHPSANQHHHQQHQQQQSYNPPLPPQHQHQSYSHSRGNHHEETSQGYANSRQYQPQQQSAANVPPQQQHHHRERERDPYQLQQQQHQQQQQQQHHQKQAAQYMPPPLQHQQQQQYNPSPYSSRGQSNVIYTSDGGPVNANSPKKVGSIADYDPMNNYFGSIEQQRSMAQQQANRGPPTGYAHGGGGGGNYHPQQQQHQQSPSHMQKHRQPPPPQAQQQYAPVRYRALYDYEAQDVDELSFLEGDLIVDCTPIDEGWLTGTNSRSSTRGMLPANYVQPV